MLLSAVSVLVVAQSISEIPEGLMNNPVQAFGSHVPFQTPGRVNLYQLPSPSGQPWFGVALLFVDLIFGP